MKIIKMTKLNFSKILTKTKKIFKNRASWMLILFVIIVLALGFYERDFLNTYVQEKIKSVESFFEISQKVEKPEQKVEGYVSDNGYEQAIIDATKSVLPSVVSIVISKNVPIYEQEFINPFGEDSPFDILIPQDVQKGTEMQDVGAGSGFAVSEDGLVLTNKHVVSDKEAKYTVYTNDGQKYSAKVLALDPVQDLAVIKIENPNGNFKPVVLGDSSGIQLGQTAIAIGNALGKFSNTVSVGIISGLQRTISASAQTGDFSETLENIIQTDAAINVGNSGGPLINLKGQVIGINTAMAEGAETIGFAIPINMAKKDIQQVSAGNRITYPFLGVSYILIDSEAKQKYSLPVDEGAFISGADGESSVVKDSAADKAGLKDKDIILEINKEKITKTNSLAIIIQKYNPGEKITLKILRDGKEQAVEVVLGERPE